MLYAGVEVLGVLAHDHEVDVVIAAGDALYRAGGADVRVEVELLPERDVDAAEAAADGRGDGALEGRAVGADGVQDALGEGGAVLLHLALPGVDGVPVYPGARGVHHAHGGEGDLRAYPVAGYEGYVVSHVQSSLCSRV